jgi:hypothetical protein
MTPRSRHLRSNSLDDVLQDVERLAADDNLAAVLIHLNDTYFIDARPPDVPGMARVAGLTHAVRNAVRRLTGGPLFGPSGLLA